MREEVHLIRAEMQRTNELLTRQIADQRQTLELLTDALTASPLGGSAAAASTSPRSLAPRLLLQPGARQQAATHYPAMAGAAHALAQVQNPIQPPGEVWNVPLQDNGPLLAGAPSMDSAWPVPTPPSAPLQLTAAASGISDSRADDGWAWSYESGWVFTPP